MTVFADCLAFVLTREGGYSNDPADPGGATNKGITQSVYNAWRVGEHLAPQDVRLIADGEVQAIYFDNYWQAAGCAVLAPGVALCVFDAAVQHGPVTARRFLQEAGPDVDALCDRRLQYYHGIVAEHPTQERFLQGWTNRIALLRSTALSWQPPAPLAA